MFQAVEQFRHRYGRLPDSLEKTDIADPEDQVFYQQEGDGYVIWFGLELGESYLYESKTGQWR